MLKKLKDINWNHLYCFYEVSKAKGLKEGAKVLGIAPSTGSEQIKKLEESFGLKLFNRSGRGLMLTKDGENLFEHARGVFEAGSKLLDDLGTNDIGGYSVNVGIEETVSYSLATEFCSQYWDIYTPFGTVNTCRQYDHDQMVDNILTNNIDWGISTRPPTRKSIKYSRIGSFELIFCCSTELYNQFIHKEEIINNIPLAQLSFDRGLNEDIINFLKNYNIRPKEFIISDHIEYLLKLCTRGRCVFPIAENPLEDYDGLTKFRIENPINVHLYALWNEKNENLISIKKLKDLINSKLEQLPSNYEDHSYQIEVSDVSEELLKGQ